MFIPCRQRNRGSIGCTRAKNPLFSIHLHFQSTVEVRTYPLEDCRMSAPFVLGCRTSSLHARVWEGPRVQTGYGATITFPAQACGAVWATGFRAQNTSLKTCLNMLKHHKCFPCNQIARAMAQAIWSSLAKPYEHKGRGHGTNLYGIRFYFYTVLNHKAWVLFEYARPPKAGC